MTSGIRVDVDDEEGQPKTSWKKNGVAIVIPSALVATLGTGFALQYLGPGYQIATDPLARPDAYTGTMHNDYKSSVNARFDSLGREIQEIRSIAGEHRRTSHPPGQHLATLEARFSAIASTDAHLATRIQELRDTIKEVRQDREYQQKVLEKMADILLYLKKAKN